MKRRMADRYGQPHFIPSLPPAPLPHKLHLILTRMHDTVQLRVHKFGKQLFVTRSRRYSHFLEIVSGLP